MAVAKSNSSSNNDSKSTSSSDNKLMEFEYYTSAKILSRVNCAFVWGPSADDPTFLKDFNEPET